MRSPGRKPMVYALGEQPGLDAARSLVIGLSHGLSDGISAFSRTALRISCFPGFPSYAWEKLLQAVFPAVYLLCFDEATRHNILLSGLSISRLQPAYSRRSVGCTTDAALLCTLCLDDVLRCPHRFPESLTSTDRPWRAEPYASSRYGAMTVPRDRVAAGQ